MKYTILVILTTTLFCCNISAQFNSFMKYERVSDVSLCASLKRLKTANSESDSLKWNIIEKKKGILEKLLSFEPKVKNTDNPIIRLPLNNISYNSFYGYRIHPIDKKRKFHYGVDLFARSDSVFAMVGGVIYESGYSASLGYYIIIKNDNYQFTYGHLSEYYYRAGEYVQTGDLIGLTGNTGKSTGEHLHFAIKKDNIFINPITFLENIKNNLL